MWFSFIWKLHTTRSTASRLKREGWSFWGSRIGRCLTVQALGGSWGCSLAIEVIFVKGIIRIFQLLSSSLVWDIIFTAGEYDTMTGIPCWSVSFFVQEILRVRYIVLHIPFLNEFRGEEQLPVEILNRVVRMWGVRNLTLEICLQVEIRHISVRLYLVCVMFVD